MYIQTRIALESYDRLIRGRLKSLIDDPSDVMLAWDSDTLVYGDGGCSIDELTDQGFQDVTWEDVGLTDKRLHQLMQEEDEPNHFFADQGTKYGFQRGREHGRREAYALILDALDQDFDSREPLSQETYQGLEIALRLLHRLACNGFTTRDLLDHVRARTNSQQARREPAQPPRVPQSPAPSAVSELHPTPHRRPDPA